MSELQTGDGATHRIWTDYHAGTVIKRTPKTIWWQRDKATLLNGPNSGEADAMRVYPGGFAAHFEGVQRYAYERQPDARIERFTLRKNRVWKRAGSSLSDPGFTLSPGRHEHRDFNF
jgi:hypothetical protein